MSVRLTLSLLKLKPKPTPNQSLVSVGRRVTAMGLIAITAGCAGLQPNPSTQSPEASARATANQSHRTYRENIALEGRLSLRYQERGEDRSVHGSFTWNQATQQITLRLLSPLGQTIAVIDSKPGMATMTQAGQPVRTAGDVDQLTAQTLGWPLPIAGLRNWLQGFGIDANGKPFIATAPTDNEGGPSVTTRDGWRIHYVSWQDAGSDSLPKRIDLERSTEQAGDVSIRIVIDKAS
jgi:outer membrane lipoprotein LolB